jgi:hypothetical protein
MLGRVTLEIIFFQEKFQIYHTRFGSQIPQKCTICILKNKKFSAACGEGTPLPSPHLGFFGASTRGPSARLVPFFASRNMVTLKETHS